MHFCKSRYYANTWYFCRHNTSEEFFRILVLFWNPRAVYLLLEGYELSLLACCQCTKCTKVNLALLLLLCLSLLCDTSSSPLFFTTVTWSGKYLGIHHRSLPPHSFLQKLWWRPGILAIRTHSSMRHSCLASEIGITKCPQVSQFRWSLCLSN